MSTKAASTNFPSETQLQRLGRLYDLVFAIGDGLGSENTDTGQVLPVSESSFSAAVRSAFPASYRLVALSAAEFQSGYGAVPGMAPLLAFASEYRPDFGLVGASGRFHPDLPDRGNFWICLYLRSRRGLGKNVLVRFQRTET